MFKASRILITLAFILVFAANAWATPVTFTINSELSNVSVTQQPWFGSLTATEVLTPTSFILNDNETQVIDFFTLTTGGGIGPYEVTAVLAFSSPPIQSQGNGDGFFISFWGHVSGGILYWESIIPNHFVLPDGNVIKIDFESGVALVCGGTVTVHAYVTNKGGGCPPVPEPATMILLGSGLFGLALKGRRKAGK